MTRRAVTGIVGVSGALVAICGPLAFADRTSAGARLTAALGGYVLVLAQARSTLPWCDRLPTSRMIRRVVRVAVYLLPLAVVGLPLPRLPLAAVGAGACIGLAGVAIQSKEVQTGLSRRYLRLLPPVSPIDRSRDLLFFGLSGATQEYLYRGLLIAGLLVRPVAAVVLATVLFVIDHLVQLGAREQWDRKDIVIHVCLGLAFGSIVAIWRSLPAAMLGHTIYNFPNVIQALIRPGAPIKERLVT